LIKIKTQLFLQLTPVHFPQITVFGSRPFSKANEALLHYNERVINWQLPEVVDEMEEK
jgi:Uracil DNA glycosylase